MFLSTSMFEGILKPPYIKPKSGTAFVLPTKQWNQECIPLETSQINALPWGERLTAKQQQHQRSSGTLLEPTFYKYVRFRRLAACVRPCSTIFNFVYAGNGHCHAIVIRQVCRCFCCLCHRLVILAARPLDIIAYFSSETFLLPDISSTSRRIKAH